jgi:surface antigen
MFRKRVSVVKSLMVIGKLSILLVSSNCLAADIYNPKFFEYRGSDAAFGQVINVTFGWLRVLDPEQRAQHTQAITHALHYAENGQDVKWWQGDAFGYARVVMTWPSGSGYCRRLQTYAVAYNVERSISGTACYSNSTGSWRWIQE